MASALDVAKWFIAAIDRNAGDSITQLKVQKLVYYAQAWCLVLLGRELFPDQVEAWAHGPAVDAVYQEYKQYGFEAIPAPANVPEFSQDELDILKDVNDIYGEMSAKELEAMTHSEAPWKDTRGNLAPEARSRKPIPQCEMIAFYQKQLDDASANVEG